jgi:cysteine-rich repeat protein
MRRLAVACASIVIVAAPSRPATPLVVAQVHREAIGPLAISTSVGGWTFASNGRDLYVSGGDILGRAGLMAHLSVDLSTGALTFVDAVRDDFGGDVPFGGLGGATGLGPGEEELYYTSIGTTAVFSRDPDTGRLALLQSLQTARSLTPYDALQVPPDGRDVLVTTDTGVAIHPRSPTGTLSEAVLVSFIDPGYGPQPPSDFKDAAQLAVRPDGRVVYAEQLQGFENGYAIVVLRRDPTNGALNEIQRVGDGFDDWVTLGQFGHRALALSADGRDLYTTDRFGSGVIAFALDPSDGRVRHARVFGRDSTSSAGFVATLSPDGGLLYTGGSAVTVWKRNATTGALERLQTLLEVQDGTASDGIEHITSSPDGRFVFVLSSQDHTVTVTVLRRRCGDGVVDGGPSGADEECDDGNFADGDGCDAACRVEPCFACGSEPSTCAPVAGPCDDGDACTVADRCDAGRCAGTPATDGTACDDGNACTTADVCTRGLCAGTARVVCSACGVCDRETAACVGMLDRGCLLQEAVVTGGRIPVAVRPGAGRFSPKRAPRGLRMHWSRADPDSAADVGDPQQGSGFHVCLLDLNGLDDVYPHERQRRRIVVEARVPPADACGAASCWRRPGPGVLAFRAKRGRPDGVRTLTLGRTETGGLDLRVAAAGRAFDVSDLHPRVGMVTAQVIADTGTCWQGALVRRHK